MASAALVYKLTKWVDKIESQLKQKNDHTL